MMGTNGTAELPPGARAIGTDELLAAIGELYVQARVMRQTLENLQRQQQQQLAAEKEHARD